MIILPAGFAYADTKLLRENCVTSEGVAGECDFASGVCRHIRYGKNARRVSVPSVASSDGGIRLSFA